MKIFLIVFLSAYSFIYSQPEWAVMPSGINTDLNAVWGTGPSNVYAVGNGGIILHFDGTGWTKMTSPTISTLGSIYGFSNNEIYALGFNLYKFDGSNWSIVNGAPGGSVIWGTSGNNLYVGGAGIKHFDGSQWKDEVAYGGFGNIISMHGISATEIYAGNDDGHIFHYKNCNPANFFWEPTAFLPGNGVLEPINGVWAAGNNDAFSVIGQTFDYSIYRYTGELSNGDCFKEVWNKSFTISSNYDVLEGIIGFPNNKLFAFGSKNIGEITGSGSAIYEYDGKIWRQMTTQTDSGYMKTVYGMWGSDTSEVFAVGQKGLILRKGGKVLTELTVNTTDDKPDLSPGDGVCDCGGTQINGKPPCSLRAAIMESNATHSTESILFDIPGQSPHKIMLSSELPVITDETKIVGSLNNNIPNVIVDGENAGEDVNGLTINFGTNTNGRKCEIKNLIITNFGGHGIFLNETYENIIQGCYIGIDADGNPGLGNLKDGINILNSYSNQIGGDELQKRNIISGNFGNGITISGNKANINLIENNFIGTKPDGMSDEANESCGVLIEQDAHNNLLKNNLISGNHKEGVKIQGDNINKTPDNKLIDNKIGTNADGTSAIKNSFNGVSIIDAFTNVIGSNKPEERNIISGNGSSGISINGNFSKGNFVTGNFIGTTSNGMDVLENSGNGVEILGGSENFIGGTVNQPGSGSGNVISGNDKNGIYIGSQANNNTIAGNLIGTKANGLEELRNLRNGVFIYNSPDNIIGGDAAIFRNIISGNGYSSFDINGTPQSGVLIYGSSSVNNKVQCNYIGLDIDGLNPVYNFWGVIIFSGFADIIGGNISTAGNTISGNKLGNISIHTSLNNKIKGNIIGLNKSGQKIDNVIQEVGIDLYSSSNNEIGGTDANEKNIISDHSVSGIDIVGGEKNKIKGNFIGVDIEGKKIIKNETGIGIFESSRNIIGGNETGSINIISGNKTGIYIIGGYSAIANEIANNLIGTNFNEDSLGNTVGIEIKDAADTYIGIGESLFPAISSWSDSLLFFFPKNKIYYNETGIFLHQILAQLNKTVHINENAIVKNITGLRTIESNNIEVTDNLFWNNKSGVIGNDSRLNFHGNTFINHYGFGSSIHLDNSYALIKNNLITTDAGDAIRLENNSTADINYNNIYNNAGFGINNTAPNFTTNAQHNWWGDANGPGGQGSGTGNPVSTGIDFSNWLNELLSVTVTSPVDTLFSPPNYNDSVDIYLGNFLNSSDILNVSVKDGQNWLQGSSDYSVNLNSTFGIKSTIHFKVPNSASSGATDKFTITAVSKSNTNHFQSDSFYVAVYNPLMTNIFVYPDTVTIAPGDSVQFTANGIDQYSNTLNFLS